MSEQQTTSEPVRPTTDDANAWKAYWQAQGVDAASPFGETSLAGGALKPLIAWKQRCMTGRLIQEATSLNCAIPSPCGTSTRQ